MDPKIKSILDNIPVEETGFPLRGKAEPQCQEEDGEPLSIVGACPKCGCPIYGPGRVGPNDTPRVRRTCICAGDPSGLNARTT